MGSLFSFIIPNRVTTPVDLIISIPTNIFMVWKERKSISIKIVIPLSLMMLIGIIPGTLLLKFGSDWILRSFLGIVIIGIAAEMFTRKSIHNEKQKNNAIFLSIIGVISGILAGLFGIGALLVAYVSRTTSNRNQFRANICCVFLVENLFRIILYYFTGILNIKVCLFALFISPAVIIGMFIGIRIDKKLQEDTIKKSVIALLAVSGVLLFVKSVLFH